MKRISSFFTEHSYRNSYILVGVLAIGSYIIMRGLFIAQDAWGYVLTSPLTLNLVIMFGLWGAFYRQIIRVKNPLLDRAIWFGGFIIIVIVLRVLGMRTIFG
jgi:hypothetical protein